jgi:hypothetical protein
MLGHSLIPCQRERVGSNAKSDPIDAIDIRPAQGDICT